MNNTSYQTKKIAVIIVTYNGSTWIRKSIQSVLDSSYPADIYVIDNLSNDSTVSIIKEFSQVNWQIAKKNLGFGMGNNMVLTHLFQHTNYDYFFLLNQDAYVEKDTLKKLIDFSTSHPDYGIISPLHYNGLGTQLDHNFAHYLSKKTQEKNSYYEVPFINAAAWLLTRACISNVGVFHPVFFHYGEDRNYTDRIIYHKFKTAVVKDTKIYHDRQQKEDEERAKKLSWVKLLTIFVNPNITAKESAQQALSEVVGISKFYIKKYKTFSSIQFFFTLLSKYKELKKNQSEYEKVKEETKTAYFTNDLKI